MKFDKRPLTFDEQLSLLESRGLIVSDRSSALSKLSHINYYRLEAYWLPFETSRKPHEFPAGLSFDHIFNHYLFDREFRLLMLDAIERIEVSIRTQWAYAISHAYGPHGYTQNDNGLRKNERRFLQYIGDLEKHIKRSDETFVQHY